MRFSLTGASLHAAARAVARLFSFGCIESPALDARLLVCLAGQVSHAVFITEPHRKLSRQQAAFLHSLIERRLSGEPVARLFGSKEFWGRDFRLGPETFTPRPESETLIEAALSWFASPDAPSSPVILDLGVGSGCLLVTLLAEMPMARALGVDISWEALLVARENALIHGVSDQAHFLRGDFLSALRGPFDVIVANPPYIARKHIPFLQREVALYDPSLALDGGVDGLDSVRQIARSAGSCLKEGGRLFLEIGKGQSEATISILRQVGLFVGEPDGLFQDLGGLVRVLCARTGRDTDRKKSLGYRE